MKDIPKDVEDSSGDLPKKTVSRVGLQDQNEDDIERLKKENSQLKQKLVDKERPLSQQDTEDSNRLAWLISIFRKFQNFRVFYDSESPRSIAFRWTLSTVVISASPFLIAILITGLWGLKYTLKYFDTVVREGEFMFIAISLLIFYIKIMILNVPLKEGLSLFLS